jgi:hypothetical protein
MIAGNFVEGTTAHGDMKKEPLFSKVPIFGNQEEKFFTSYRSPVLLLMTTVSNKQSSISSKHSSITNYHFPVT